MVDEFPILVTERLPINELVGWIAHFYNQGIPIDIRESIKGGFELYRVLTDQEIQEIKSRKMMIMRNSFATYEKLRNHK